MINMVVTKKNIKDIPFVLDFVRKNEVWLRLAVMVPLGNELDKELVPDIGDLVIATGIVQTHGKDVKFTYSARHSMREMAEKKHVADVCFALVSSSVPFNCEGCGHGSKYNCLGLTPTINELGEVRFCNFLPMSAGNIKERSFRDIYLDPKNHKDFFDIQPLNELCKVCRFRGVCIQVCRANAYMKDGVFNYPTIDSIPERCIYKKNGLLEKKLGEIQCQPA
jgi:radical SAM protein with 4Fe4S-binding SPASM domain